MGQVDLQGLAQGIFRRAVLAQGLVDAPQVGVAHGHVGMLGAQQRQVNRQRALHGGFGAGQVAAQAQHLGQVADQGGDGGVVVAESLLADAHGMVERNARGDELALHLHDRADVAVDQANGKVVGAIVSLQNDHGLVEGIQGLILVTHLLVGVAKIVPQRTGQRVALAKQGGENFQRAAGGVQRGGVIAQGALDFAEVGQVAGGVGVRRAKDSLVQRQGALGQGQRFAHLAGGEQRHGQVVGIPRGGRVGRAQVGFIQGQGAAVVSHGLIQASQVAQQAAQVVDQRGVARVAFHGDLLSLRGLHGKEPRPVRAPPAHLPGGPAPGAAVPGR